MSDLGSLLRDRYEDIAPPIDVERLAARLATQQRPHPTPSTSRGIALAVAAAIVVLLLVGGMTLFLRLVQSEVVEEVEPAPDLTMDEVGIPFTILDSEGDAGAGASVIVGDDGIPLVAYVYHPTGTEEASEIRIAQCGDAACTESSDVVTIAEMHQPTAPPEEGGHQYAEIRMLMPGDGLPIVVWVEWEEVENGGPGYLRTYKCSSSDCSSGTLTTIGERTGSTIWATVGPDNHPFIAQRTGEWRDTSIEITKCTDPSCTGGVETAPVEMPGVGWGGIAVTVDDANLPVIAAQMSGEGDGEGSSTLAVARCTDPICAEPPQPVDLGIPVSGISAVVVDPDDRPVVLAGSPSNGEGPDQLTLVACTDTDCSTSPVATVMSSPTGEAEPFGSLAIESGGSVAVGHVVGGAINVATCPGVQCDGGPTLIAVVQDAGSWPDIDMALASSGNPVIAIHANTELGMIACASKTCAESQIPPLPDAPSSNWTTTIASLADVSFSGTNPAIEIGPDGRPVVAYLGLGTDRGPEGEHVTGPRLLVCSDAGCSTSITQSINDESAWVAMTMRPNGLPVVVYSAWTEDYETDQLFVAWCADPECSDWTTEKIDETDWFNSTTRIASRPDGSVAIVYQNGNYYVSVISCDAGSCDGASPVQIDSLVDPNDNEWGLRWWMNSLDVAVLPDGRPVISAAQSNGELRYVECTDRSCTGSQRTTIDQTLEGVTAEIGVGSSGLPIVAYYDDGELSVGACHDTGCSDPTITSLSEATAAGTASVTPSIAFGPSGNPMIAYWAPRALVLAECHDPMCKTSTVDLFAAVRTFDLAILPSGSPVLAYFAYSDQQPPAGEEGFGALVDLRIATCRSGTCVGD